MPNGFTRQCLRTRLSNVVFTSGARTGFLKTGVEGLKKKKKEQEWVLTFFFPPLLY